MLSQKRLKEILHYDPLTGDFTWRVALSNRARVGEIAGWLDNHGYWRTSIDNKTYLNHRLAWLYVTGAWPVKKLDHWDTDRSNNRWKNLRAASIGQNGANSNRRSDNTSGFKGVTWSKSRNRWVAQICVKGRGIFLGHFDAATTAHAAYVAAAVIHFGEFARTA